MLPAVAIGSLGGTITMTPDGGRGGVTPTLSAEDLIASVPALEDTASIEASTLASLPGASLSFDDVLSALRWAREMVGRGAAGVVLVQGTDTIEETAYLLDLHWDLDEPLVVTGAMRSPGTPGADGAANLLAAVQVAAAAPCRARGVLVAMNDEVHAATRVCKRHATDPSAFTSPVFGPLAVVSEGRPIMANTVEREPALPVPPPGAGVRVALVSACFGEDGAMLRLARSAGYGGVVIAGFGVGHVGFDLAAAVSEGARRDAREFPVVLASTTGAGTTLTSSYGFSGSESDMLRRGVLLAGWLGPRKARILLWSLLTSNVDAEGLRQEFARRGGVSTPPHLASRLS